MPNLVADDLPYFDHATTLRAPDGSVVKIKHRQIIQWVSVTQPGLSELPPNTARFPAVVDIGFNDNFLIQEQQLHAWSGLTPNDLYPTGLEIEVWGTNVPLLDADLWIFPNLAGFRDQFRDSHAFHIELNTGIAVCPIGLKYPRLPLIGMLALERRDLQVSIDTSRRRVSIEAP